MGKHQKGVKLTLSLLRAGIWEKDVRLSSSKRLSFDDVYRLADEQSVVGFIAAGLDHVVDIQIPKNVKLSFAGYALLIEQRNLSMNTLLSTLTEKLYYKDVSWILVKGQGIAQCYERPLWRACGDIDMLLDNENYDKAKNVLTPIADKQDEEVINRKHLGLYINDWLVELHGTLKGSYFPKIDACLDKIQEEVCHNNKVRSFAKSNIRVLLPAIDEDLIIVFTHIHQHLTQGGVGLRQICDWCRLLWKSKETIDVPLLERRLREMGLMTEWKVFAALAVDYLGMPVEAMPFYSEKMRWRLKAKLLLSYIIKVGNLGHNKNLKAYSLESVFIRKVTKTTSRICDYLYQFGIFPLDTLRLLFIISRSRLNSVVCKR